MKARRKPFFLAQVTILCVMVELSEHDVLYILQSLTIDDEIFFAVLCLVSSGVALTYLVKSRQPAITRRRRTGKPIQTTEDMAEALANVWQEGELTEARNRKTVAVNLPRGSQSEVGVSNNQLCSLCKKQMSSFVLWMSEPPCTPSCHVPSQFTNFFCSSRPAFAGTQQKILNPRLVSRSRKGSSG